GRRTHAPRDGRRDRRGPRRADRLRQSDGRDPRPRAARPGHEGRTQKRPPRRLTRTERPAVSRRARPVRRPRTTETRATGATFRRSDTDGRRRRSFCLLALTRLVHRGYTTPAMRIVTSLLLAAIVLTLPLSVI